MGQFNSGVWIVMLSLYFLALFVTVTSALNISIEYNIDNDGLYANDNDFFSSDQTGLAGQYQNVSIDSGTSSNMNTFFETIKFLTGFGTDVIGLGIPAAWNWIFSFIFFYIPLIMLVWSIYMALPFAH